MRTSQEHAVNQITYARKIQRWKTYVVVTIYVHQIAYARQENTCVTESRTTPEDVRVENAYVAEDTYSTGRCTSSKCTYARRVRMSSEGTYATGRRTSSRKSLEYESRIFISESVVGVSLTESIVGTRLFAQTSDGPKCSRMLPKQYHLETLR